MQLHLPYFSWDSSQYAFAAFKIWGIFYFMELQFWRFSELTSHKLLGRWVVGIHSAPTRDLFSNIRGICAGEANVVVANPLNESSHKLSEQSNRAQWPLSGHDLETTRTMRTAGTLLGRFFGTLVGHYATLRTLLKRSHFEKKKSCSGRAWC